MIIHPAALPVLPEPSIIFQAVDRQGIGITLVEILDLGRYPRDGECCSSCWLIDNEPIGAMYTLNTSSGLAEDQRSFSFGKTNPRQSDLHRGTLRLQ